MRLHRPSTCSSVEANKPRGLAGEKRISHRQVQQRAGRQQADIRQRVLLLFIRYISCPPRPPAVRPAEQEIQQLLLPPLVVESREAAIDP